MRTRIVIARICAALALVASAEIVKSAGPGHKADPLATPAAERLTTLVRMAGYKVAEMPVNHRARRFGVSKYGAMNRAARGLADCLAVRWMSKRMLNYRVKEDA